MHERRDLMVLGSTGSIGTQALEAAARYPERVRVTALSAHSSADKLFSQVRAFRPMAAALTAGEQPVPDDLRFCRWYFGRDAMTRMVNDIPAQDVLVSVVGMASLECVRAARLRGLRVLLANKETLVAGGQVIMPLCGDEDGSPTLIPVDSEHSAVYQCLKASLHNPFRSILLTASGGPFRTWTKEQILSATREQALCHPNWSMGQKITIDSATMFNKALEIIEAKWLFDARPEQIRVLIHPESIVHSLVEFEDGAQLAQLGVPSMLTPIMYAMFYPDRAQMLTRPLRLEEIGSLTFYAPDTERFPAIRLAYEALNAGGAAPSILNAANEQAVAAFLSGRVAFGGIFDTVNHVLNRLSLRADTVEDILYADSRAREEADGYLSRKS